MCLDACPTGALVGPGQIHAGSCISFVTQTKGFVEDRFKEKIGNRLYGCDTCQVVCPKNKGKNWTHQEELTPDPELAKPLLRSLLSLSNKEFKARFGASAAAWRGRKPLQRNAIIGLGHFRDVTATADLGKVLLEDARPALREAAAWALGRIGSSEAQTLLQSGRSAEVDEVVLGAIDRALEKL
jgi:epoxyqueuosine reductase